MTCFRLGANGTITTPAYASTSRYQPQPLVEFSPSSQDRATLMTSAGSSRSAGQRRQRRRSKKRSFTGRQRRKQSRVSKIRIVKGRVALRISGRPGVQHIGAGQLVRFVPLNKLRAAARRVLGPVSRRRRRQRRGGQKRRQRRRR